MEAVAVIGRDGPDPSRRTGARDRHIAFIEGAAAEGLLLLGLPIHTEEGRSAGSLMVVPADRVTDYLAREPFAQAGVWAVVDRRPMRIPRLPWRPWPGDAPAEGRMSILFADGAAPVEALAVAARDGWLLFAAATRDREGAVLVTTHAAPTDAQAWAATALPGCRLAAVHPTRWRPLPYPPLPSG
ncbi:hypothetical protein J5Y09_15235 [Roseomonas sp. PWR1]|uniref:YCII-related domain-containing protein n=1 Tax=Roseomonas nitratireducens TaxID=2820810 RepID=A0ABS4AV83_9PROT|nr:hypothetical protein [Neoroseomonas nitratireducens]MBP0465278.1 hypothetical protein [Neoroseomonas nitratireducens]